VSCPTTTRLLPKTPCTALEACLGFVGFGPFDTRANLLHAFEECQLRLQNNGLLG